MGETCPGIRCEACTNRICTFQMLVEKLGGGGLGEGNSLDKRMWEGERGKDAFNGSLLKVISCSWFIHLANAFIWQRRCGFRETNKI